jgi:hypothetical protein
VTVLSRTRHGLVGTLPGMRRFGRRSDLTRSVDQVGLAQYNVYEARTHFSRLIARSGEPLAKLVPYRNEPRVPGVVTAQIVFDAVRLPRGQI